jgi:hypothetical protein
MKITAHKCDGPECTQISESAEGWIQQEMEPWPATGLQPYCEMVAPNAKSGFDMLFVFLTFCSHDCQHSWWARHNRECGCHSREMQLFIRLPIPYVDNEDGKASTEVAYWTPGEVLDEFGRFGWPRGAEWCCGRCLGPVEPSFGEHACLDPVCHSETPKLSYGY